MVIDTSAALAILVGENDDELFAAIIEADPTRIMSAVSVLETSIVVEARKGPVAGRELDLFLHRAGSTSFRSMHTSSTWRGAPTAASAKDIIVLHSISATAARTRSPQQPGSLCCSKAAISPTPTSRRYYLQHDGRIRQDWQLVPD
jgi:PIN domain